MNEYNEWKTNTQFVGGRGDNYEREIRENKE
jgi:hypothetical protein